MAPLTFGRTFSAWTLDIPALLAVALLGVWYLTSIGQTWPRRRTVAFLAGLGTIVLVTQSFLAAYAGTLFWARAAQNVTLLMITPLLLALGAPVTLVLATVPDWFARRLRRLGRGRAARTLTFPLVVTVLLVGSPFVLYLSPLYPLTLRSPVVDGLVRAWLVGAGFVYFWTRLRVDPTPRRDPYLVSLWISLTEVIFDGVLGLVLWLGPLVAAGYYLGLGRHWGPDPRLDQIIGAGILWIGGDLAGLPFVCALIIQWRKDDERTGVAIDRELDAASDATLWWEHDPVLAERFRRQR